MRRTLRRSLSQYVRTRAVMARARRVGYITDGDVRYRVRQLIRKARAIRLMSRPSFHFKRAIKALGRTLR